MHLEVAVCLPHEAETVTLIRTAIADTLAILGVADDCLHDLKLALSEACTNVITHASGDDEYEVGIRVDGVRCTITVRNTGGAFDAASLTGVMPAADSARGRGVAIMHAVMDHVHLTSDPEAGTIVTLARDLTLRDDAPLARLRGKH